MNQIASSSNVCLKGSTIYVDYKRVLITSAHQHWAPPSLPSKVPFLDILISQQPSDNFIACRSARLGSRREASFLTGRTAYKCIQYDDRSSVGRVLRSRKGIARAGLLQSFNHFIVIIAFPGAGRSHPPRVSHLPMRFCRDRSLTVVRFGACFGLGPSVCARMCRVRHAHGAQFRPVADKPGCAVGGRVRSASIRSRYRSPACGVEFY